jgi:hypothetical protein
MILFFVMTGEIHFMTDDENREDLARLRFAIDSASAASQCRTSCPGRGPWFTWLRQAFRTTTSGGGAKSVLFWHKLIAAFGRGVAAVF